MQYNDRIIRHELKYVIDEEHAILLRQILCSVMTVDSNMKDSQGYLVSSIYFDDYEEHALNEKIAGVNCRRKFRIRSYNMDEQFIRLECKEKYDQYIAKISAVLSKKEYECILAGDYEVLSNREEEVCKMLYVLSKTRLLRPVVVVEYRREAYVFTAGNVRVTFDKELSSSIGSLDLFADTYATRRVMEPGKLILEVKYDDFLPEFIRQSICIMNVQQCSASKYVMCRNKKREVKFL